MAMPEDGISVTSHPRLLIPNPWLLIPAFKLQGLRKIALYMPVVLMLFLHRKAPSRIVIPSGDEGKVKMDKCTGKKNDASLLHDICGHRPIYLRRSRHLHS